MRIGNCFSSYPINRTHVLGAIAIVAIVAAIITFATAHISTGYSRFSAFYITCEEVVKYSGIVSASFVGAFLLVGGSMLLKDRCSRHY